MRFNVSIFAAALSLAAAPTLALCAPMDSAGPSAAAILAARSPAQPGPVLTFHGPPLLTDEAMSRITAGEEISISVPTTHSPVCIGEESVRPPNGGESSNVRVTFSYPPSPCGGEVES